MIQNNAMFHAYRQHILAFARTHQLPTVCGARTFAEVGCLMAYAPNLIEMFRRAAIFVDRILKGATPADLPLELPQKLELVLNRTTAEALGVTLPPTLLIQADEVIK
jgi:putative ABC transport system substrate-binding protein